jgi:hypothetical protein
MSKLDELKAVQKKTGQSWAPPPREIVKIEPIGGVGSDMPSSPPAPEPTVIKPQPQPKHAPPVSDHPTAPPVDPRPLPVDTTERIMPYGSHIYPDRYNQLRYEAFTLAIKPWEVIEIALAEYFERRYRNSSPTNKG